MKKSEHLSNDAALSVFEEALISHRPSTELGEAASVYSWLIGSWEGPGTIYFPDGSKKTAQGEWHFAWTLEGRAIQDVFIAPLRSQRNSPVAKEDNRYGITIRVYDYEIKAWRIDFYNPPQSAVPRRLIGNKKGNEIIQEGKDLDGSLIRWNFGDIQTDSFRWYAERSKDEGKTWNLYAEFFGNRK